MRPGHQHFNVANLVCCRRIPLATAYSKPLLTFVQVINITAIVATIVSRAGQSDLSMLTKVTLVPAELER